MYVRLGMTFADGVTEQKIGLSRWMTSDIFLYNSQQTRISSRMKNEHFSLLKQKKKKESGQTWMSAVSQHVLVTLKLRDGNCGSIITQNKVAEGAALSVMAADSLPVNAQTWRDTTIWALLTGKSARCQSSCRQRNTAIYGATANGTGHPWHSYDSSEQHSVSQSLPWQWRMVCSH